MSPSSGPCEFLVSFDAGDCGAAAERCVSVRHQYSDVWQSWPVCRRHERALVRELRSIGFVVSDLYGIDDLAGRAEAEAAAA